MKNQIARIHDDCLEYEHYIVSAAEELEEKRIKAYKSRDMEDFRLMIPILNGIAADVEAYREYLLELMEDIILPVLKQGDPLIISNAGSYGAVLSPMQFSSQRSPAELFLDETGRIYESGKLLEI